MNVLPLDQPLDEALHALSGDCPDPQIDIDPTSGVDEPQTLKETMDSPDWPKWKAGYEEELQS